MRAFVITAAGQASVQEVEPPIATAGEAVIDVQRVGLCGTDLEFFSGHMQYLDAGHASFPIRIGHEWTGTVSAVGAGVDRALIGSRVIGDTMLGCGDCARCRTGRQHVCEFREEVGIRGGRAGALADQLAVPASSLHVLPESVDVATGALVEPGGNALRAVRAAQLAAGDRLLVLGPGTIGLLAAMFARADGIDVHLLGPTADSLEFARSLGFSRTWTADRLPSLPFDAVIDASTGPEMPARALELVEPGKRVVYIGLASTPSLVDTRRLVLEDVIATGILSASPGLAGTIERFAAGTVDPRPLVAATVGLDDVAEVLGGRRPEGSGRGPKIHVDPRA